MRAARWAAQAARVPAAGRRQARLLWSEVHDQPPAGTRCGPHKQPAGRRHAAAVRRGRRSDRRKWHPPRLMRCTSGWQQAGNTAAHGHVHVSIGGRLAPTVPRGTAPGTGRPAAWPGSSRTAAASRSGIPPGGSTREQTHASAGTTPAVPARQGTGQSGAGQRRGAQTLDNPEKPGLSHLELSARLWLVLRQRPEPCPAPTRSGPRAPRHTARWRCARRASGQASWPHRAWGLAVVEEGGGSQ